MSLESSLEFVLVEKLREMYQSERQMAKQLPKLIKNAKSPEVKTVLQRRLDEASEHLVRLEVAFDTLDRGLSAVADRDGVKPTDRAKALTDDAQVLSEAQRAQHHHVSSYRTLATWASALGHDHVSRLLYLTLEQEVAAEAAIEDLSDAAMNELMQSDRSARHDRSASQAPRVPDEKRLIPKDFMAFAGK